jgi:hypothetical protein
MSYNQFENTKRLMDACITLIDEASDRGLNMNKFRMELVSEYERTCFKELRAQCALFIALYDEMDTVP